MIGVGEAFAVRVGEKMRFRQRSRIMGRRQSSKFIPDGDSDFACMARVFADHIARDPARYQLSASNAEQISSAVAKFREALTAAIQVGTRNKITIMKKDEARAKAERIVRKFGNIIRASSEISAIDKMVIRVKERPTRLERRECPKTPPQLMFVGTVGECSTDGARHILHFREKFGAGTRAKPAGAARIELFVELIDPEVKVAPKHPGELSMSILEHLDELAESIQAYGLLQPIVVRDVGDGR
jgi:hypothetical protein